MPPSGQTSPQLNPASAAPDVSYPQFVEVLSLLAGSAAGRLRSLYPDVAGAEPGISARGASRADEHVVGGSAASRPGVVSAGQSKLSALEKESTGASEGSGKHTRRRNDADSVVHRHIGRKGHEASRLRGALGRWGAYFRGCLNESSVSQERLADARA